MESPADPQLARDARTKAIVAALLARAARDGEIGIAWARLLLGTAITAVWPLIHGRELARFVPSAVATISLGVIALVWSVSLLLRLRTQNPSLRLTYASITLDAVLINALVLGYVLSPGPRHQSIVEVHGTAFVYLTIVSAGIRLSRRAALFGAVLNSVLFATLVAVNTVQVGNWKVIGPAEWLTVAIGLIGSTLLGVTIATRTKRLVEEAARETLQSAAARSRLGAYISPEVADVVLKEDELRLGGERRNVAVLFSDLRGFTAYSERMEPEEIVTQLNDYMSAMVDVIAGHHGIVDKFMGDGIMAVFGAPTAREDDVDRAIECAKDMMRAIDAHNQARAARGLAKLRHGIGVHYGPVVAGNVGTQARAAYTVIGDTVNLASRLEGLTRHVGFDVVASAEAIAACRREHGLTRIDEVQVPGRNAPVTIYGG